MAALVAWIDCAPAAFFGTSVAKSASAPVGAVLTTATADLFFPASWSRHKTLSCQLEIVDIVQVELLTAPPRLAATAIKNLPVGPPVKSVVPDPPDLRLHPQACHTGA